MELSLTTPALLFPAIAILMLGYVNRYTSVAGVIRDFKKDYDSGYTHVELVKQLKVLKARIEILKVMLTMGAAALFLACLSMLLIYKEFHEFGKAAFGLSLLAMLISLGLSIYETTLSNKSLKVEINDIIKKEDKK